MEFIYHCNHTDSHQVAREHQEAIFSLQELNWEKKS